MKLTPLNSNERYLYWKCSNPRDNEYTLVKINSDPAILAWVCRQFENVEQGQQSLPGWRLYTVTD